MSFQVVLDGPPRSLSRGLRGMVLDVIIALIRLIGFVGGLVTIVGGNVLFWGGAIWLIMDRDDLLSVALFRYVLPVTVAALAVWLMSFGLGLILMRRRRKLVLFLRKFGHVAATRALTRAALMIGGRWRLVTLDDERITAIGAPSTAHGVLNTVGGAVSLARRVDLAANKLWRSVVWIAGLGAAGIAVHIQSKGQGSSEQSDRVKQLDITRQPADTETALFQLCVYLLLACLAVAVVYWALSAARPLLIYAPSLAHKMLQNTVTNAEFDKLIKVENAAAIRAAKRAVRSQCDVILGARLMVLNVSTPIWRQTVSGFAEMCAIPLVDITAPTENIVWEIREMLRRFGQRCIFVGQYDRILTLYSHAPPDSSALQVRTLLRGHQILAYTSRDPDNRHFVKALRATLELRATLPKPA